MLAFSVDGKYLVEVAQNTVGEIPAANPLESLEERIVLVLRGLFGLVMTWAS